MNSEGGAAIFDARTGEGFGGGKAAWMAPKKASEAMGLRLLDGNGAPEPPPAGCAALTWANNSEHPPPASPLQLHASPQGDMSDGTRQKRLERTNRHCKSAGCRHVQHAGPW